MSWHLKLAQRARKALVKFPAKDRARILDALEEMSRNPFSGDIVQLKAERASWRRRVGNYRILFDVYPEQFTVEVVDIVRRTSVTY